MIRDATRPRITGYLLRFSKELTGLARAHSNFLRFSGFNDSGRTKNPYNQFVSDNPADTIKGTREPNSARKPPSIGPMINPKPNAAPRMPKFCARVSGVLTSAIYAPAVV